MNLFTTAAVIAALLTGPLPQSNVTSRDLAAPGESAVPQVAQNEREVQPAPLPSDQKPEQRIAAFWIIVPD